jgi:crossover junction endodeoxyribonuclease RusA
MKDAARPIMIDLPFPPSANSIWASKRNKFGKPMIFRSKRYEAWKRECFALLMAQRPGKVRGPFFATITLGTHKRRKDSDADNRIKPTLDLLEVAEIIENDKYAERVTVQWGEAPEGCRVLLEPVTPVYAARELEAS